MGPAFLQVIDDSFFRQSAQPREREAHRFRMDCGQAARRVVAAEVARFAPGLGVELYHGYSARTLLLEGDRVVGVRLTEFRGLMQAQFGPLRAPSVSSDHVFSVQMNDGALEPAIPVCGFQIGPAAARITSAASRTAAMDAAMPMQIVLTGARRYCIVS